MKTRTQSEINIDFDEASAAWKQNKKRIDNGCYIYVCGAPLQNGKFCQRTVGWKMNDIMINDEKSSRCCLHNKNERNLPKNEKINKK